MKRLFLTLLFLVIAAQAQATTYWTSSSASSTTLTDCDGDADPGVYCTFASIYSGMSAGDTLKGKAGTYNTSITTNPVSGSSSSAKTTITCETTADPPNGTAPVCIMRPTSSTSTVVLFSNAQNWSFQNWKFDIGGSSATNVSCVFGVSHDTLNDNWELINNEFTADGKTAFSSRAIICMQRNPNGTIRNNSIHDCEAAANPDCHGIYFAGSNALIENNLIYNIGRTSKGNGVYYPCASGCGNAYGISYFSSSATAFTNGVLRYNRIHSANRGILLGVSNTGAEAYGNVITYVSGAGIAFGASTGKVYNNTIHNSNSGLCTATSCLGATSNCTGTCTVRNNISVNNASSSCTLGTATNSNNLCTGTDTDIFIDPSNATIASRDLNLKESSAAIAGGVRTGLPSGISCVATGSTCDQGAYQAPVRLGAVIENATPTKYSITFEMPSQSVRSNTGLQTCTNTDFAVRDDGAGMTESSCTVVGTAQLDITLSASMTAGVADDAYTRGTLKDNVNIGGTYAKVRTYSAATATNNVGGAAATLTSLHYRCLSWYSDTSPATTDWVRAEDASNSTLRCPIRAGGFGAVAISLKSSAIVSQAFEWHANRNGGAYAAMTNTCSATAICFANTNAPALADAESIASAILTSVSYVAGQVIGQQATRPVIAFTADTDTNVIVLVKTDAATAVGDSFCIQPAPANGAVGDITQTQYPCFEIVTPASGF